MTSFSPEIVLQTLGFLNESRFDDPSLLVSYVKSCATGLPKEEAEKYRWVLDEYGIGELWDTVQPQGSFHLVLSFAHDDSDPQQFQSFLADNNINTPSRLHNEFMYSVVGRNMFGRGRAGHIDLVSELYRGTIKYVDPDRNIFYFWDKPVALWRKKKQIDFESFLYANLPRLFRPYRHRVNREDFDQTLAKVCDLVYIEDLAKHAKKLLYDPDFEQKINSMNHLVPFRHCKVYDFANHEVRPRTKEDCFATELPVVYDPEAKSPLLDDFLDKITVHDKELLKFLLQHLSRCVSGCVTDQSLYIWYGPKGANGKSTLVALMEKLLGDFFAMGEKEVFINIGRDASPGAASPHLYRLRGRRLVIFAESSEGDKINESHVKVLTGNDSIPCRPLYGETVQFKAGFISIIMTNHRPKCSMDPSLWRRIVMIPFFARFVDNPRESNEFLLDPGMREKLLGDPLVMSSLLNLLISVDKEMSLDRKIFLPPSIMNATEEYKVSNNVYLSFLNEMCVTGLTRDHKVRAESFYQAFCNWFSDDERLPHPSKFSSGVIATEKVKKDRDRNGFYYYGVQLKTCEI